MMLVEAGGNLKAGWAMNEARESLDCSLADAPVLVILRGMEVPPRSSSPLAQAQEG